MSRASSASLLSFLAEGLESGDLRRASALLLAAIAGATAPRLRTSSVRCWESAVWWVPPAGLRRHLPLQLRRLLSRHLVAAEACHSEAKPRFLQGVGTGRVLRLELRPLPNLRRRAQGRERLNGAMRRCCFVVIGRALCRAPPLVAKLGGSCGPASCRGHSCAGSQQGSSGGSSSRGLNRRQH